MTGPAYGCLPDSQGGLGNCSEEVPIATNSKAENVLTVLTILWGFFVVIAGVWRLSLPSTCCIDPRSTQGPVHSFELQEVGVYGLHGMDYRYG